MGKKVLLIDLDPQSNLSIHLGINVHGKESSIYQIISGKKKPRDVLKKTAIKGLDLIPSDIDLASAEIELVNMVGRETIIKFYLEKLLSKYDYVLIDCPPSLGLLTLNALTVVREIFIPLQTEFFALQGVSKLLQTFEVIKKRLNNTLSITGIIPCMYDSRTKLGHAVLDKIKEYFDDKVFGTIIRKNVKLSESPSHGIPIALYAPESNGARDYEALSKEIIAQEEKMFDTTVEKISQVKEPVLQ
ncbi:MAG: chromosome partitioning protein ParA [Candidatus Scalindua rubra]|uniref:Chromosome partitioning protein ParA n=1 Tax=Candidatus Scalindua rubra TaxID=1872076 RepID=A0A1E3XAI8_9BACT|nr:MAG: chromosome partitioning protein ParA [Candidatus Scalindua rubra]